MFSLVFFHELSSLVIELGLFCLFGTAIRRMGTIPLLVFFSSPLQRWNTGGWFQWARLVEFQSWEPVLGVSIVHLDEPAIGLSQVIEHAKFV